MMRMAIGLGNKGANHLKSKARQTRHIRRRGEKDPFFKSTKNGHKQPPRSKMYDNGRQNQEDS